MGAIPPTKRHRHDYAEVVSALQKSVRRGDEEAALYFATELETSGYGEACFRRLLIMASEDIGLADPLVCVQVQSLYATWTALRKKKEDRSEAWRLMLVHAVLVVARASKSRIVDHALITFYEGEGSEPRDVPDVALDKHTLAGKRQKRGWQHFWDEASLLSDGDGELKQAPHLEDPYRERAVAARQDGQPRKSTTPERQLSWHNNVSD